MKDVFSLSANPNLHLFLCIIWIRVTLSRIIGIMLLLVPKVSPILSRLFLDLIDWVILDYLLFALSDLFFLF